MKTLFLLALSLYFPAYAVDVGGGGVPTVGGVTYFDSVISRGADITRSPAINASAALEVNSVTQGFLLPRMTEAQRDAIVLPAVGMTIYNTDKTYTEVWDGFYWTDYGSNITTVTPVNTNTGVWTIMNWTTEQYDPNKYIAVPATSFTIPRNGSYIMSASIIWSNASTAGARCLQFNVPAASSPSGYVGRTCMQCPTSAGANGQRPYQSISASVFLRQGDIVSVQGFQDSGVVVAMGVVATPSNFSIAPVGK